MEKQRNGDHEGSSRRPRKNAPQRQSHGVTEERTPLSAIAYLHRRAGDETRARKTFAELTSLARERYVSPVKLAQAHVGLGEMEQALDRLEDAGAGRAADFAWLNVRPEFAPLRARPRFQALARLLEASRDSAG
jgi:hypothetical protein